MGKVQQWPPGADFLADCVGIDRGVQRSRGCAEHEEEEIELAWRVGERGQQRCEPEGSDGERRQPRADSVAHHACRSHRDDGAETDEHERQPELPVVRPRLPLHGGQGRSPGAPEDPEGGEAEEDARPTHSASARAALRLPAGPPRPG